MNIGFPRHLLLHEKNLSLTLLIISPLENNGDHTDPRTCKVVNNSEELSSGIGPYGEIWDRSSLPAYTVFLEEVVIFGI